MILIVGEKMKEKPKFIVRKDPNFRRFYSSGVYGGHTPFEFKMIFFREGYEDISEETFMGKTQPMILRELQVEITMSPEQAKVFLDWLKHHIEEYEKNFGKIPSPRLEGTKPPSSKLM